MSSSRATEVRNRVAASNAAMRSGQGTGEGNGAEIQRKGNPTNVQSLLSDQVYKHELARLLGNDQMAERFLRVGLTQCRRDANLFSCTWQSFAGALLQCAQLKLEPGQPQGHAWIIPYRNKHRGNQQEAQFQLGYTGVIQLAMRSGQIANISARPVRENDEWDFAYGSNEFIRHKPAPKDRGDTFAYYGVATFANGGRYILVMSLEEMLEHKKRYVQAKTGPWYDDFDKMGCKTVILQMKHYLPQSADFVMAMGADERTINWRPSRDERAGELDVDAEWDVAGDEPDAPADSAHQEGQDDGADGAGPGSAKEEPEQTSLEGARG